MNEPKSDRTKHRPDAFPLVPTVFALLCIVVLAATTIGGALATNWRVGEVHRARIMREVLIAEEFSLDLVAVRRGREEFLKTCTACHGPKGEAKPNLGKALYNSEFVAGQSDSQLRMFLKLGRNTWDADNTTGVAMPPKGGNPMITDDDLVDLVQFLRFLQADARGPAAPKRHSTDPSSDVDHQED